MYVYKSNRTVVGVSAQNVGEELERISENGPLTPSLIVEESKPATAVLHPVFEWNNKTAGQLYREHQARLIVNAVVVVPEANEPAAAPVQAFISVTTGEDSDRQYMPAQVVASTPVLRDQHLAHIKSRLKTLRREYAGFVELAQVWSAVDAI